MALSNAAETQPELEEEQPQQPQVPEGGAVVNLEPDDADDLDEGQGQGQPDPNTLDRRGRRNFVRTIKAENEDLKRQLAELKGRMDQVALHQQVPQRQEPPPSRQVDPVRAAMADTRQQMQHIARLLSSKDTPAGDLERLQQQYMDLDERRIMLAARAVQPQQPAQQTNYTEEVIRGEYPEIFARQDLWYESSAEFERLKAANHGQHGGLPMIRQAIERVLTRHGVRQKRLPPNPSLQAKLGGTPARAGAGGGGSGNSIVLDKAQRRTAIAYYNNTEFAGLSDDEKVRKWTKEVWLRPDRD